MSTTKIPLHLISVASPCTASWDAMSGDDTTRFCGQCAQYVYNLSEMTEKEAQALIYEHEGKMCVRYYKRTDGTMLTKDCPVGWRAVKKRVALIGAAGAAVFVAAFTLLTAGVFAASVRGNGRGGVEMVNPIARVWDALFGRDQDVQGGLIAPPGVGGNRAVMGDICPDVQPPIDLPLPIPPVVPEENAR